MLEHSEFPSIFDFINCTGLQAHIKIIMLLNVPLNKSMDT